MATRADRVLSDDADKVAVGDVLGPRERLEFERLLQWLRLCFVGLPVLVVLAFGTAAVAYATSIAAAAVVSFTWVALLLRYRPRLLLRIQLWLRVIDCGLVYLVLINYHAFLHDAYYDSVYVLFVVAAAATHGRRGAWFLSCVAGLAVLVSRVQLINSGAMPFEARHLTDPVFYTVFFLMVSRAVAFLMHKTEEVVMRRERALSAELTERHAALERTAKELAESVRMRDALLAGVTHDLRTPITVIKVQAQLLRRRTQEKVWPNLDQIERAAARMARWIDELLEAATAQRGEDIDLSLAPVDLVKIAGEAIEEHQASSRRHQLRVQADPPEIVGLFDVSRIERLLDNLVGNAIKYSPEGGPVDVSLTANDGWVTIVVSDQGIGIPAPDLATVFEPFHRAGNVVGRIAGTGIGLASARRIVEHHGGTLAVESEPGKGSTFTIRLPLAQATEV